MDEAMMLIAQQFVSGIMNLKDCLISNTYPSIFLKNVLGLSPDTAQKLPKYLLVYISVYLLCGLVTLFLHFGRRQMSLNGWTKQAANIILTLADFLFLPSLFVFARLGRDAAATQVSPYQGELSDAWRYFSQLWTALFPFLFTVLVLLFTVLLPIQAAWRYLKMYRLSGLPHMVLDVGTGLYLACTALLSMSTGSRLWYVLLVPALLLLCAVQFGGYIPDSRNTPSQITRPMAGKTGGTAGDEKGG